MSRETGELFKEALTLPAEAQGALVDALLESLDTEVDVDAEAAWQVEIRRRAAELDSRTVSTIPWVEVRTRLMAALGDER